MTGSGQPGLRSQSALQVAQMYYLQDLTMDTIAREMNLSRSSVSRLLADARTTGLVEITVHSPQQARGQLAQRIAEEYGVTPHIVATPDLLSESERLRRVALAAARILSATLDSNMVVGVAWGATTSAIARLLPSKPLYGVHVVQMNGAANTETSGLEYASDIINRFGAAYNAQTHQFPVPAFFDEPLTRLAMWRERSVRSVLAFQSRVDVFVFGLGSPKSDVASHVYAGAYFDADDMRELARSGAVGDCATVFYRLDGSSTGIPLNERSSGPDLDVVRRIPHRLCVVSSVSKIDSLIGALAAGLVTELVIDESVARRLVSSADEALPKSRHRSRR